MQKIIEYLTNNPKYATVLYASLAVIALAIILIFVFRAVVEKKRENAKKGIPNEKTATSDKTASETPLLSEDKPETIGEIAIENELEKPNSREAQTFSTAFSESSSAPAQENAKSGEKSERTADENLSEEPTAHGEQNEPQAVWQIEENGGAFSAKLLSQSGKILLKSDDYTSLSGVKSGIDTLKNNVASSNYAINVNRNGKFYFKVFSTANRLLCVSGEFNTRNECENAFEAARRASKNANLKDPEPQKQ